MAQIVPVGSVLGITGAQGKGMRIERYTARFAFFLTAGAAGIPAVTALFGGQDAQNNTPAAGVNYQSTKGVFRNGSIIDYNYINVRNVSVYVDYGAALQNQADLNTFRNMALSFDRQSEVDFLRFAVYQAWGHTEHYQATTTVAASTLPFHFPFGVGYDVSNGGKYQEAVYVNTPTVGNATGNFTAPGIWLMPGPVTINFLQQRGIALLNANATIEVALKGYRLVTNVA